MSNREERVARNEAASREINEEIDEAHQETPPGRHIRMLCECGHETCDRTVAITPAEYERVRSDARQFVVMRDHVMEEVERVVSDTDRFVVVTKREGSPAEVATDTDPRT
ncbi:MAG TPA: hypothetical protein VEM93_09060 [Actinomycetota bacterium]|nr:hypothetical protein [Actinomycetota bacterium]